jgi:hypothetical protein
MKATNHDITWLQTANQTEIMLQYQSLDSRERGKLRLIGMEQFGTRILPLMRCRSNVRRGA